MREHRRLLASLVIIAISVAVVMFFIEFIHDRVDPRFGIEFHRVAATLSSSFVAVVGIYLVLARYQRYRDHIEAALRDSEERFRNLIDVSSDWIWEVDENYTYTYASPQVRRMLGFTPEDLLGKPCLAASAPAHGQHCDAAIASRLTRHEKVRRADARLLRRDGGVVVVETSAVPRFDDQGKFLGYYGMDHDITARKRMEADRESLIAELEDRNARLEQFLYTASHELKTPLVSINGTLGLLERDVDRGYLHRVKARIARASVATAKMHELIEGVLCLSRVSRSIDGGEETPLGQLAEAAAEMAADVLAEHGVKLEIAHDLPPVWGDRVRLVGVLRSLLENAVKFMGDQPHPKIEVGSRRNGEELVCYVRDNGEGIDPRFHERIFNLFEQLDPNRPGSGIGLTIARRIVEMHGGRLWVESEGAGKGSTFCFTLSRKPESVAAERHSHAR
ncbi:MAG: sensor histidine kinase [Pirellulales bacterium]